MGEAEQVPAAVLELRERLASGVVPPADVDPEGLCALAQAEATLALAEEVRQLRLLLERQQGGRPSEPLPGKRVVMLHVGERFRQGGQRWTVTHRSVDAVEAREDQFSSIRTYHKTGGRRLQEGEHHWGELVEVLP